MHSRQRALVFQGLFLFLHSTGRNSYTCFGADRVVACVVTVPGLVTEAVRQLADSTGVEYREREFAEPG